LTQWAASRAALPAAAAVLGSIDTTPQATDADTLAGGVYLLKWFTFTEPNT
jgi:hypothetical protein